MRTRLAREAIDWTLLRQTSTKPSHELLLAELLDLLLSMPRHQRADYLDLCVDLLLEADLPVHVYDRALDLLWKVAFTPHAPDLSTRRAHQALLADLLGVEP